MQAWVPIVVAVIVLIGTLAVGYWQYGRRPDPPAPSVAHEDDPFVAYLKAENTRLNAKIDRLEAEAADDDTRVALARVRAELKAAVGREAIKDAEIQRLDQRVRWLQLQIEGRVTDD